MSNSDGVNKLAKVIQNRISEFSQPEETLDFGTILSDYSLLTNLFPIPIPKEDYLICRSVSYNPSSPLTMTYWKEEGLNSGDWKDEVWDNTAWGKLVGDDGIPYWDKKHKKPPITGANHAHGTKGQHDHDEDADGKHYHDVYLPKKMHWIKPGDRVLVAWVQDDPIVVDIIYSAKVIL